jgi:murein DD-endopeptidase MepM/ murein hydrolase activator NlpD
MIESQTEFPAQERGPATIWAKGRRLFISTIGRLRELESKLAGTEVAKSVRDIASLLASKPRHSEIGAGVSRALDWIRAGRGDGSLLHRYALHLVVVLLAIAVVSFSQFTIPEVDLLVPAPSLAQEPDTQQAIISQPVTNRGVNRFIGGNTSLFSAPVAHTTVSERERMQVITYTVQPNDNIYAIAQGFGLNAETVLWANSKVERAPDLLSVGQELIIPPVDGVYHTVQQGDTVEKLAKTYETSVDKIISFELNQLEEPYTLATGQRIMLPDGRKKVTLSNYYPMTRVYRRPQNAPTGSGRFAWPAQGILTQKFWSGHTGIDIGSRTGTPIYAADDGYVVLAGVDTWGYGNQVLIDHGNGYLTRYAHLHTIGVRAGQSVKRDQQIGTMGSTGRSTGPHLHFEIIYSGVFRNPLGFLP